MEIPRRRMRPRWRKILQDLNGNKTRTFLVVMSIAIGVFAVGFVSTAFTILLADMDEDYQSVNPHGAIIACAPYNEELLNSLSKVPYVKQVEGRSALSVRVKTAPGKKVSMTILAVPKIGEMQIDRLRMTDQTTPPELKDKEIYIERSALLALPNLKAGDSLEVELMDGRKRSLRVAAIVHDVTAAPYIFTNRMSAYVNLNTMEWLGGVRAYNQVYLNVTERQTDKQFVESVAQAVAEKIQKSGIEVYSTYIFQPGRHYASDFTLAIGMLLGFLGALAVLLSAFLVVNTIIARLGQHIPQIGIMKLNGGSSGQISGIYLLLVFAFGLLAFVIAAPLSAPLGYVAAKMISQVFNFNLKPFRVPPISIGLELFVAFFIPFITALYPLINGTRITITEAIANYGIAKSWNSGVIDRMVEKIRLLPRPLLISLRNTFRRKGRLILTLSTLVLAGAIFISVFNLWSVIDVMMDDVSGYYLADVTVTLSHPYRKELIIPMLLSIPEVVEVEGWGISSAQLLTSDKKTSTEIVIIAPPAHSKLIQPVITAGRWLEADDENALVVGNHLLKERPEIKIGDEVVIKIDGVETKWEIVGNYQIAGMMAAPIVYANNEYLEKVRHDSGRAASFRALLAHHDGETEKKVLTIMDEILEKAGIPVNQIITRTQFFSGMIASMNAIVLALLIMAVLIAAVGGLGLTGMMSMNVMDRTREIGVMRSIGASDGMIYLMVIAEGLVIGLVSWLIGVLLALPLTYILSYVFGLALVNSPLRAAFSPSGYVIWLLMISVIAIGASFVPARKAANLTIREVLAYE